MFDRMYYIQDQSALSKSILCFAIATMLFQICIVNSDLRLIIYIVIDVLHPIERPCAVVHKDVQ